MLEKLRRMPRALYFLFAGTTITRLGAFVFPYLTIYLSEARGYGFDRVGLILSVGSLGLLGGNFAGGDEEVEQNPGPLPRAHRCPGQWCARVPGGSVERGAISCIYVGNVYCPVGK